MANPTASIAASRLPVDVRALPWIRHLTADYIHDFVKLASFFAGDPNDADAWRAAIARAQQVDRPHDAVAAAIVEQQQRHAAPPPATAAAADLADPRTVAVVTGQQAGLFGGPLYTLLKAVTAIRVAAEVNERFGVAAVPVFWVESEDHDWNEVATCHVLDRAAERRAVTLPRLPGAGIAPVARIQLDATVGAAIDALQEALPPTEFTPALIADLRESYGPGATMSAAFARWMGRVLGEHRLVVFDAADPALKKFARRIFAREISEPGRTSAQAAQAGRDLEARGYHTQVMANEDALALFHLDGAREGISRVADAFMVGATPRTAADLARELDERPAAFSPNVLLRPLVQDSIFPTVAYIAGPNELAYLAQLRGVYDRFRIPMPLMVPRTSATLLDSAAQRFITKTGVRFEALARDDESELNRFLEQQLPPSVDRAWQEARAGVTRQMEALTKAVPLIDPTLEGAARSTLGRMMHDLETLHGKIVQAAKRRDETLRRQFTHARALAFPGGEPQERAVGFVYFLNRYGPALVERLLAELPLDARNHWVLSV